MAVDVELSLTKVRESLKMTGGPARQLQPAAVLTRFLQTLLLIAAFGHGSSGAGAVQLVVPQSLSADHGSIWTRPQLFPAGGPPPQYCNALQLEVAKSSCCRRGQSADHQDLDPRRVDNPELVSAAVEGAGEAVREFLLQRSSTAPSSSPPSTSSVQNKSKIPQLGPALQDELNNRPLFSSIANLAEEDAFAFLHADSPHRIEHWHAPAELEPRIQDFVADKLPTAVASIFADALQHQQDHNIFAAVSGPPGPAFEPEQAFAAVPDEHAFESEGRDPVELCCDPVETLVSLLQRCCDLLAQLCTCGCGAVRDEHKNKTKAVDYQLPYSCCSDPPKGGRIAVHDSFHPPPPLPGEWSSASTWSGAASPCQTGCSSSADHMWRSPTSLASPSASARSNYDPPQEKLFFPEPEPVTTKRRKFFMSASGLAIMLPSRFSSAGAGIGNEKQSQEKDLRNLLARVTQSAVRNLWEAVEAKNIPPRTGLYDPRVSPVFPGRGVGTLRRLRAFLKAVVALDYVYHYNQHVGVFYLDNCPTPNKKMNRSSCPDRPPHHLLRNHLMPQGQGPQGEDEETLLGRIVLADLVGAVALADSLLVFNRDNKLVRSSCRKSSPEHHFWAENFRQRYLEAALLARASSASPGGRHDVQKYLESLKNPNNAVERGKAEAQFLWKWLGTGAEFGPMWAQRAVAPPENAKWQFLSFRDDKGGPRCANCMERRRLKECVVGETTSTFPGHQQELDEQEARLPRWRQGDLLAQQERQPCSRCSCGFSGLLGPGENLNSLTVRHVARRVNDGDDHLLEAKAVFLVAQLRVEAWAGWTLSENRNAPSPEDRARATLAVQRELLVLLRTYLDPRPAALPSGSSGALYRRVIHGLIYLDRVLYTRRGLNKNIAVDEAQAGGVAQEGVEGEESVPALSEDMDTSWRDGYSSAGEAAASEELPSSHQLHGDTGTVVPGPPNTTEWAWDLTATAADDLGGDDLDGADGDTEDEDGAEDATIIAEVVRHRRPLTLEEEEQFDYLSEDGIGAGDRSDGEDYHSDSPTSAAGWSSQPEEPHLAGFADLVADWKLHFPWADRMRSSCLENDHDPRLFLATFVIRDGRRYDYEEAAPTTDIAGHQPQAQIMAVASSLGRVLARPNPKNRDDVPLLRDVEKELLREGEGDELLPEDDDWWGATYWGAGSIYNTQIRERRLKQLSGLVLHPELEVAMLAISLATDGSDLQESDSHTRFWQSLFGFSAEELGKAQKWLLGQMGQEGREIIGAGGRTGEYAAYESLLRNNLFPRLGVEQE